MVILNRTALDVELLAETLRAKGIPEEKVQEIVTTMAPPRPELPADAMRHRDVCRKYGIPKSTLAFWIDEKGLESWKISHKERYVSEAAVKELVESRKTHS